MKITALIELARLRQSTHLDGYACIGDFHHGIFECDHVSPFTKSGNNVDAEVMIVGQDWSSTDKLASEPPDMRSAKLGYTPNLPTNKNLDALLMRHFRLTRAECYLTNLFPFVKQGNLSTNIPFSDLIDCAQRFTLREIGIVSPQIVICLGIRTFNALRRASGIKGTLKLDQGMKSQFCFKNSMIYCVAHTGRLGMNHRGREQVESDWQKIARRIKIQKQR